MKRFSFVPGLFVGCLWLFGAGCVAVPVEPSGEEPAPVAVDPYEGWNTIEPGGVISLRIPPNCKGDPAAGNLYIVCPTLENENPPPDMHLSSDGIQVNIRRWEDQSWDQWDKVIASLKVIQGLDRDIQINIQH